MQINRRKYNRARCGAVRLQAQYRGRTTRKNNAAKKIQSYRRMHVDKRKYNNLQSATISLQCRARRGAAKKEFDQIKREAKDMGKIKEHNEKLKMEMASLKAMLQAQAASDADKVKSKKAIAEKQEEINRLEARIAQLEGELENEKENVKRLENNLNVQKEDNTRLSQDLQYQKEMALALRGASTPAKHSRNLSGNELQKVPGKHARNFSANELLSTVPAEAVVDAVVVANVASASVTTVLGSSPLGELEEFNNSAAPTLTTPANDVVVTGTTRGARGCGTLWRTRCTSMAPQRDAVPASLTF